MNALYRATLSNYQQVGIKTFRRNRRASTMLVALLTLLLLTVPQVFAIDRIIKEGGFNGPVNAISEPDSNGVRYVGGDFTAYGKWLTGGGAVVDSVYFSEGSVKPTFPRVNGEVYASVADGSGGFFIGGTFDSVDGIPRSNAAHIEADGSLGSWAPEPNGSVRAMIIVGSTVYMGGGFTQLGGVDRNFAGAVNVNGTIAETWKPLANGKVYALAVEGSTIYLGGAFTEIDGNPRNHLAAVALSGELNTTWAPNVNDDVLTITIGTVSSNAPGPIPMLLYFGGDFTQVNGTVRNHAAAVGLDGAVSEWSPNVNGPVNALLCRATDDTACGTVFIGGSFTEVGGIACNNLASWY